MRLFTAIELPDDTREHLSRLLQYWRNHLDNVLVARLGLDPVPMKWVPDENLHATLKFLGEVPDADMPAIRDALAAMEWRGPMRLQVHQVECLPPRGPVRVIAAGLDGDIHLLQQLHESIERVCDDFGIPREQRAFCPHITLARLRIPLPAMVRDLLAHRAARHMPGPPFETTGFALVRSVLLPDGPRYERVSRFGR